MKIFLAILITVLLWIASYFVGKKLFGKENDTIKEIAPNTCIAFIIIISTLVVTLGSIYVIYKILLEIN